MLLEGGVGSINSEEDDTRRVVWTQYDFSQVSFFLFLFLFFFRVSSC